MNETSLKKFLIAIVEKLRQIIGVILLFNWRTNGTMQLKL